MVLTINSKFRPFSYDELVKPLVQYQQAYEQVEKDYSTLATQAEVWKDIATQENNPVAFAMYQRYSNDLNRLTDDFSQGMNANNRRQLLAMKKRYAAEIAPIARADASMKEANKYRDTVRAKDPSAIFKVSNYTSLDDFLNGNTADNSYISGNQVTARVAARAQAAGTALFNQLKSQGMSDVEAMAVIQSGQHPTLQKIYNEEWEASGAKDFGDEGKLQVQNAIQSGMNNAVAKVAEGEYMTAAQRDASARGWQSLKLSERQQEMAKERLELEKEQQKWAREQKEEQIKGVLLPNGNRLKPIGGGRMLEYNEDSKEWKIVSNSASTSTTAANTKVLARTIIVDKAAWGSGWGKAGYEGEDSSGSLNWIDLDRKTRDWGADYSLPPASEVTSIKASEVDITALGRIRDRAEESLGKGKFNVDNYNFYKVKGSYGGIIARPKNDDPYASKDNLTKSFE